MAYQAFEKMRLLNRQRFGKDTGPFQPGLSDEARTGFDLKSAVSRFLHERCENLLFDGQIEEEEERMPGERAKTESLQRNGKRGEQLCQKY